MPRFEITWKIFGVYKVDAVDEDEAKEFLDDELFGGPDWDGMDYDIERVAD